MLGLSLCVAIALSFRAVVGVKGRTTGRLVGTSHTQLYTRYTIGPRRVAVSVEPMLRLGRTPDELHLLAHTLNDAVDDNTALIAAMGIFRSPSMANTIPESCRTPYCNITTTTTQLLPGRTNMLRGQLEMFIPGFSHAFA